MLSASLRSPAFPPLSDPLSALRSLPWEEIREASLSASLFALALLHALAARLWSRLLPSLLRFAPSFSSRSFALPCLASL